MAGAGNVTITVENAAGREIFAAYDETETVLAMRSLREILAPTLGEIQITILIHNVNGIPSAEISETGIL
jgi:hypothetical protein